MGSAASTNGQLVHSLFSPKLEAMRTEVRLIKTEPVPKCGTYEVRVSYFSNGTTSKAAACDLSKLTAQRP